MTSKGMQELFAKVAKKHNTSVGVVEKVYNSMWGFMRTTVKELPDLKELSIEELAGMKTNFHIPNFCKFFIDIKAVERKRNLNKLR
jgi:hypothetical protein